MRWLSLATSRRTGGGRSKRRQQALAERLVAPAVDVPATAMHYRPEHFTRREVSDAHAQEMEHDWWRFANWLRPLGIAIMIVIACIDALIVLSLVAADWLNVPISLLMMASSEAPLALTQQSDLNGFTFLIEITIAVALMVGGPLIKDNTEPRATPLRTPLFAMQERDEMDADFPSDGTAPPAATGSNDSRWPLGRPFFRTMPQPIDVLPPAQFKDAPLVDASDLADHPHTRIIPAEDVADAIALTDGWRLLAASRRGLGHQDEGSYREDDVSIRISDERDITLIAIADGVGDSRLARHGARAAVLGATAETDACLRDCAASIRSLSVDSLVAQPQDLVAIAQQLLDDAYDRALAALLDRVRSDQTDDATVTIADLQTTLQIILVIPHHANRLFIACAQTGDGAVYARRTTASDAPLEDQWHTLLAQQIAGVNNEVVPLGTVERAEWQSSFRYEPAFSGPCVMAMTDGTADDLRPSTRSAEDPYMYIDEFQRLISERIAKHDLPPAAALLDFLGYRKKQSLDDRTVVFLYRDEEKG